MEGENAGLVQQAGGGLKPLPVGVPVGAIARQRGQELIVRFRAGVPAEGPPGLADPAPHPVPQFGCGGIGEGQRQDFIDR